MRYRRAVEKLRALAEACESVKGWPPEDPFLLEAYVFGDVLRGADPLECAEVVLVLNLPPQEVAWGSNPHGTEWLADRLRLSKGGFAYWWRSHLDPVANHHIGSMTFPGRRPPRMPSAGNSLRSWKRRSATFVPCTPPTGTATGAASIAGVAATRRMSCGRRSTAIWTCVTPLRICPKTPIPGRGWR